MNARSISWFSLVAFVVLNLSPVFAQTKLDDGKPDDASKAETQLVQRRGVAKLEDGEVISGAHLELRIIPPGTELGSGDHATKFESNYYHCQTDAAGRFEIELPEKIIGDLEIVVTQWSDGDRRFFITTLPANKFNTAESIELNFAVSGKVTVGFFGTSNLPSDTRISLNCRSLNDRYQSSFRRDLPPNTRYEVIDRLPPGKYEIEVRVPKLSPEIWTEQFVVSEVEDASQVVTFQFPEFARGTISGRVILPDGKTPAAGIELWGQGVTKNDRSFGGEGVATDSDGRFSMTLPAGDVRVIYSPRTGQGNAANHSAATLNAIVKADSVTDIGDWRIQHVDEVYAMVEGRITYSDDQPVESRVVGAGSFDRLPFASGIYSERTVILPATEQQLADGIFQFRVREGKSVIQIGIDGTGKPLSGAFRVPAVAETDKWLLIPLDVSAGQRLRKNIVVPRSEPARNLKIVVDSKIEVTVSVLVKIAPDMFWMAESRVRDGEIAIENLPQGETVIISEGYLESYWFRSQALKAGHDDVVLDLTSHGDLRITLPLAAREDYQSAGLELDIETPLGWTPFKKVISPAGKSSVTSWSLVAAEEGGILKITDVAPGTYRAKLVTDANEIVRSFQIVAGQLTSVGF